MMEFIYTSDCGDEIVLTSLQKYPIWSYCDDCRTWHYYFLSEENDVEE